MQLNVLDLNAVAERIIANQREREYLKKLFRVLQEGKRLGVLPSIQKEVRDESDSETR
ncbi:MAG: hypothetical protein MUC43_07950 [Pirellula sp.]|jgi:F0F1-type ATP synthase delta subunit|nr:hypothetical protein [Pirellula sp.]